MVIPKMVRSALAGDDLLVHGDGQQTRCFCHVHEAVQAIKLIMESDECNGEVINVGSDEEVSILSLANTVKEIVNSKSMVKLISYEEAFPLGGFEDMRRRVPAISKASNLVGWKPQMSLREIVSDVVEQRRLDNK
jgi:UDP-glucose 4-epimerase